MSRLLPFPLMALAFLALWLLLTGSVSAGALLMGCVLAMAGGWMLVRLQLPRGRLHRPVAVLRLVLLVLVEVVRSNNAVARIILRPSGMQGRRSGFVRIPLDMRNPYGQAALACIVTATPGTLWVDYDQTEHAMLLHVLDLIDEEAWVRIIKDRWERRLMEIFE